MTNDQLIEMILSDPQLRDIMLQGLSDGLEKNAIKVPGSLVEGGKKGVQSIRNIFKSGPPTAGAVKTTAKLTAMTKTKPPVPGITKNVIRSGPPPKDMTNYTRVYQPDTSNPKMFREIYVAKRQ